MAGTVVEAALTVPWGVPTVPWDAPTVPWSAPTVPWSAFSANVYRGPRSGQPQPQQWCVGPALERRRAVTGTSFERRTFDDIPDMPLALFLLDPLGALKTVSAVRDGRVDALPAQSAPGACAGRLGVPSAATGRSGASRRHGGDRRGLDQSGPERSSRPAGACDGAAVRGVAERRGGTGGDRTLRNLVARDG